MIKSISDQSRLTVVHLHPRALAVSVMEQPWLLMVSPAQHNRFINVYFRN
jgi:hypothetical protein